jgi:predicted permease
VPAGTPPTFRLSFYARLRDGVSLAAAQDEIAVLYDSVRSTTPANRPRLEVAPVKEVLIEPFKPAITVLAAAVVLVLLIACVNVANLVLARSTVRRYEMALRAALGASRGRLLRQHLAEGTLLALCSGTGGLAIAAICMSWLRAFGSSGPRRDMLPGINIPRLADTNIDLAVAGFALVVSVVAGIAFGLIAGARRPSLAPALRRESRPWSLFGARGIQHALVVAEVAMAVMLFVGSALMIRSFSHLSTIDTGFAAAGVTTFQVTLPPSRPLSELTRVGDALVDRIAAMAPVHGVGYAESLPMVPVGRMAVLSTTPVVPKPDPSSPRLDVRIVSHGYLDVMGIRIAEGRGFSAADGAGAPRALLINETLAREMFAGRNAVGQRIYIGGVPTFDPPGRSSPLAPWEVIGVVADVRQRTVIEPATPQIFVDQRQVPGPINASSINVVVRMDGDPAPLLASLRPLIAQLDAAAFVDNVARMDQIVSNTYARPKLYALVLGIYAAVAISLAAIGIYGVMAFAVVRRTREIGIRMALGARRRQVQALVVRDSAIVAGAGLVIGIGGAVWSSRLFEGMLFGITPLDRTTYAAVAAAFAAIAMLAAVIPARRASAVDPVLALRSE